MNEQPTPESGYFAPTGTTEERDLRTHLLAAKSENQKLREELDAIGRHSNVISEDMKQLRTQLAASLADCVVLRGELSVIARGAYDNAHDCLAASRIAKRALATEHPGAPLIEAVRKAKQLMGEIEGNDPEANRQTADTIANRAIHEIEKFLP